MGSAREDVDLDLVLNDPQCAREFISGYDWGGPAPSHITVDEAFNEMVWFDRMSDLEAIAAAKAILKFHAKPREQRVKNSGIVDVH